MLNESDLLGEGLNWENGKLVLGDPQYNKSALIPVKLGRNTKSLSTTKRIPYYKAYQFNKRADKSDITAAKYAIKKVDTSIISMDVLQYMINKSVLNFSQLVGGIDSYDLILSPRSSGKLNVLLIKALHAKMHRDVPIYSDSLIKRAADNLVLDTELLANKFNDKSSQAFYRMINSATNERGEFKIRLVPPIFRKIVLQMLKLDPSKEADILQHVVGKRVLVVDDITTEGTTLYSAYNLLKSFGAKEVHGFIFLKSSF